MTVFSLPRETSLHRNRDASLLSAIPSLRSLRISFPAPSSKLDIFAKRQVVTCLFCLPVGFSSFPKSSALLRERSGWTAFQEFFNISNNSPSFAFKWIKHFSSLHDTSIRRKLWRVAPCKSHPFHSSLDLDIIAKRQVVTCLFCLSVGFSSFPKSSAILFGNIPDDLLFGIFSILSTTPALDNLFSPCLFAFLSAAPILPKNAVCWETPFIAAL